MNASVIASIVKNPPVAFKAENPAPVDPRMREAFLKALSK